MRIGCTARNARAGITEQGELISLILQKPFKNKHLEIFSAENIEKHQYNQ